MIAIGMMLCTAALLVWPGSRERVPMARPAPVPGRFTVHSRAVIPVVGAVTACSVGVVVGGVHAACAAAVIGATVWTRHRRASRGRAHDAEIEFLTAGLDVVIGELGVGTHPALACATAASEGGGSAAVAFGRAAGRARLGGDAHAGLALPDSVVSAELSRVSAAWKVSDEYGLGLVEPLTAARADVLSRRQFRDRTRASLAGARATGTVLACLPVLGILLGQLMGANPLAVLLGGGIGGVLLVVGSVLVCAGLAWTDAITERVTR
ncbi:type II secretion system F family protein [Rhodococcoides yunnanense]|uniref:type II secretion system F family protein n=1 Tax=Rhodococcoides yunnanense TaxID=278209 RepID=UPI00093221C8|nr:type ii secretion system integral membrane subunit [Rhodococcus yunnanensis]